METPEVIRSREEALCRNGLAWDAGEGEAPRGGAGVASRYARVMYFAAPDPEQSAAFPDPTLTFWLAVFAVFLSVVSSVAAVIAVRQTWLYHPRPHWQEKFTRSEYGTASEPRPGVRFDIDQLGPGDASAVELWVKSPGRVWLKMDGSWQHMKAASHATFTISLVTGDASTTFDEVAGQYVGASGEAVRGTYLFQVRWRQSPRTSKLRTKNFRYRA